MHIETESVSLKSRSVKVIVSILKTKAQMKKRKSLEELTLGWLQDTELYWREDESIR